MALFTHHRHHILLLAALAVAITLLLVLLFPRGTASRPLSPVERLAACLRDKGVTMYGVDTCPECQNQKQMFQNAFTSIMYVNCDFQSESCESHAVKGYPTWISQKKKLEGLQPLPSLAAFSGCPYSP